MEREGEQSATPREEKTTESALRGIQFRRTSDRTLNRPPRRRELTRPRYRFLRLARTLAFFGGSRLNSSQREPRVCCVRRTQITIVLPIKVCANVCAKRNGRLVVARK